jgi:hypothetical protein
LDRSKIAMTSFSTVTPVGEEGSLAVPRPLLLGPALVVGTGLIAYFGFGGFGAMAAGRVPADRDAVLMIGGYTVWGVGLLGAAAAYAAQRSRPRGR